MKWRPVFVRARPLIYSSKLLISTEDNPDRDIVGEDSNMAVKLLSLFQEPVSSDWLKFAVISNALFVM